LTGSSSFLFSLYANDEHSSHAIAWLRRRTEPISLTPFNEFELANALRFAEFRQLIPTGAAASYFAQVEAAIAHQRLIRPICNLASILSEAQRLSATHTVRQGNRSFGILHVATAVHLAATDFLTFDRNQKRLAEAEQLNVPELI
jgi:predicted nucleic acid-binding protein